MTDTVDLTPNFDLSLPPSNRRNWTDLANDNFRIIDALMGTFVAVSNLAGSWTNNIQYTVGQNVIDVITGTIWTNQVIHTTASAPGTFAQERTAHPTYWSAFSVAATNRGAWTTGAAYNVNDFVVAGSKYAVCIAVNTAGASFAADLALGYWSVLVDLSAAGSLVLPVLAGAADANKIVTTDALGAAYVITTAAALRTLLGVSPTTAFGTAAFLNVGITNGLIVQLTGSGLPAVSGSQLTGLTAAQIPGSILQVVENVVSTMVSGVTTIPYDNTTPQITEGVQFFSVTITPQNGSSKLEMEIEAFIGISVGPQQITTAVFQDSTANAIFATTQYTTATGGQGIRIRAQFYANAVNTTPRTYTVRIGGNGAATFALNSLDAANPIFGGVCASFLRIKERQP